jgi:3-oxoacyl-[acyl-carrier protein] reductase
LANQLGQYGITVNNVMPGYIHTDRVELLAQYTAEQTGQSVAEVLAELGQPAPVRRLGQPKELGALVAFLASEQAAYINGVSIPVDGGRIKSAF